ncbi:hypothetical protein GCM10023196_038630 [Actinoallomurus vinaceus]|uniref:Xylose isomerase-like TIM barrel domain-containing protein n=1 Tax=Actinoallomurus vinaceus TaxID=1080074 RepID=A0ABP8U9V5_9ACTN
MPLTLPFASGIAAQEYLSAEEGAARAHEHGCTHWYIDFSLEADQPCTWSPERVQGLRALTSRLGVSPILHGNFRAPLATEIPEVREGTLRYLSTELHLAERLGCPLVIHGGCVVDPRPTRSARRAALARFLSAVELILEEADRRGVEIWVENLSHYPRHRPFSYVFTGHDDFAEAKRRIPELTFVFDIGHANVNQGFPVAILDDFAGDIRALSVSNNDGQADSHLGLHAGTIPLGQVVGLLKRRSWQGTVVFETRGTPVVSGVDLLRSLWERN